MPNTVDQKIRLLALYELLYSKTDERHALSTQEIIEELSGKGIDVTRKTIYDDIALLNQYGYEVLCERWRSNRYYVVNRQFERSEIQVLLSAIGATQVLSNSKSLSLMQKLLQLIGVGEAEEVEDVCVSKANKHSNEKVYYIIDALITAINNNKKVSFLYFDYGVNGEREYRRDKRRYIANPLGFVYSDDKLYLVCYHDNFTSATNYRVDRMDDVQVDKRDIVHKKEFENFNIDTYRREQFDMFGGQTEEVGLMFPQELSEIIIDRFGEGIRFISCGNSMCSVKVNVQISKTFFAWLTTFEGKMKIESPSSIKEQYASFVKTLAENI